MGFREKVIENYVERALREFDANPVAKGFLRRLADESPAGFLPIAMRHLQSDRISNAHAYMAALAVRHEDILDFLASPAAASRDVSQKLFRRFLAVDPSFDVRLARKLPDRHFSNHSEALSGPRATRALDILDHNSQGRRLLPILGHLPNSPDVRLAAKGALFVGRRVQSPTWSSQLLARPDPRIRANAVETLWGMNTPVAIQLLEQCVEDRNNRVQGNALVGLHLVGRGGVDVELMSLARTGSAPHRSTAAWVMGRIAQERWIEVLTLMVRDEHPKVRSRAFLSLKELRRIEGIAAGLQKAPEAPPETELLTEPTVASSWREIVLPTLRLDGSSFQVQNPVGAR